MAKPFLADLALVFFLFEMDRVEVQSQVMLCAKAPFADLALVFAGREVHCVHVVVKRMLAAENLVANHALERFWSHFCRSKFVRSLSQH